MLQKQLANQESQSCDPPAAVARWCFAWSFSYSMCSKMFNTAETLAKMGLKRYLDLPCIDANEKLNSGNYKSIPFLETGSVMPRLTIPVETDYLLLNGFSVINLLR